MLRSINTILASWR